MSPALVHPSPDFFVVGRRLCCRHRNSFVGGDQPCTSIAKINSSFLAPRAKAPIAGRLGVLADFPRRNLSFSDS